MPYFLVSEPLAVSHMRMVLSSAQLISCLLSGVYITCIEYMKKLIQLPIACFIEDKDGSKILRVELHKIPLVPTGTLYIKGKSKN
jgi:hypothetical protein